MVVTPALFAANLVVARWAESAALPPLFLAFGRWALAFALLLPAVGPRLWAHRHAIMAHFPRLMLLAALGMGLAVGPQYIGARHTGAANIAIIFAACPALVMLLETLVWKAPLSRRQAGGMLLAILGVLVVLSKGDASALGGMAFGTGDLWVVLAASGWVLYTVLGKRMPLPPLPSIVKLAALIGGGALVLAPFAVLEASLGNVANFGDPRLYIALAFLAVVPSLGAYFCFDRLISMAGPARASMSLYLSRCSRPWPPGRCWAKRRTCTTPSASASSSAASRWRPHGAVKQASRAGRRMVGSSIMNDPTARPEPARLHAFRPQKAPPETR